MHQKLMADLTFPDRQVIQSTNTEQSQVRFIKAALIVAGILMQTADPFKWPFEHQDLIRYLAEVQAFRFRRCHFLPS